MILPIWKGQTVVCIGTGPSLTQADVDACRDRARVIVINDAYKNKATACLWADALYACDAKWWKWHKGAPAFEGLKYTLESKTVPPARLWPGVVMLRNLGRTGLSLQQDGIKTGHDSGYQAINLAALFGAARILLLGYDMRADKQAHCFGAHPDNSKPNFDKSLKIYPSLIGPLREAGISLVNCTRRTALTCFPQMPIETALEYSDAIRAAS